ncbi:bbbc2ba7-e44e-49d6-960a-c04561a073dc [Sclerotinia trifoliorum]|uniref:Bbbc2ba7-e44e-49d6-960a-c04561a073dc n=1 Tax=Sclerotinia trifoliorum TaxID=28548 RepID=A0A8H2ZPQ2_9HELO|nr:bbbc2ba7-e44e-49d6-960a-c04561a073dc [Sclerotinia trifoliorum]
MMISSLPALGIFMILADVTHAAFKPPFNNTLERGVATECKTCPYSLCTNKEYYDYDTVVSLICWTTGTIIGGDSTWLRTSDDCYITQYDLTDYAGEYEDDLSFCGHDSTIEHYTTAPATTKYNTECNLCDDNADCAIIKYLKYGTDITVTCWTDQGDLVINDSTWLKTTDNCYVAQIGLEEPANKAELDYCGPVGFLQLNYTEPAKRSSPLNKNKISPPPLTKHSPPSLFHNLNKRYLLNITVGEDYAPCYSTPSSSSDLVRKYEWDQGVWVQCFVSNFVDTNGVETYGYLTTDFCYVREADFWESLFDQYRYPDCDLFESGSVGTDAINARGSS